MIEVDIGELDLRAGFIGLGVLAIVAVLVGVFGPVGMAAGIAALFVLAGAVGTTARSLPDQGVFIAVGAAVTLLVGYSAGSGLTASLSSSARWRSCRRSPCCGAPPRAPTARSC